MENIRRMYNWKEGIDTNDIPKTVTVLYFADYDPTGTTMSVKYKKWLSEYGINFVRVALNHEYILSFFHIFYK